MRRRISFQLIAGFVAVVTVAVLIIGFIFIGLYQRAAIDTKKEDMLIRARNLSPLLSGYLDGSSALRGMGGFFKMMDAVNEVQIWILDAQGNVLSLPGMGVTGGMMGNGKGSQNNDAVSGTSIADEIHADGVNALPSDAVGTIQTLLAGQETSNETFSDVYGEATLTVGVPIVSEGGSVIGGVLMHAPVNAVTQGVRKAYVLLFIGLAAGLLAAILLGIVFSLRFTNPLKKMSRIAHAMADGNYAVRTSLHRPDEIGQLGDDLDHLAVALGIASEESDKLEQMRRDFIANVSHEFRTPLTIIRGSAEALRDISPKDPSETEKRVQAILSETNGMNRLVGDLLELSRLESGRVVIQSEPIWPNEILDDVWRSLSPIAAQIPVFLSRDMAEGMHPVLADYGRFRQLLLIFLDNAVKHSPSSGTIMISARPAEKSIQLRITDQGPGILPEDLPYVWERFYTVDKARNQTGTGLGLPIARQLADLMNASVSIESTPGSGTTVVINMPVAEMPLE